MLKKIVVAALSATTVLGVFAIGMSGCSNNNSLLANSNQNLANSPEFHAMVPSQSVVAMGEPASVSQFNMEAQGNQLTAQPSQRIKATAAYIYNCTNCKPDTVNQILVGLAGRSAQACIYNGGAHGDGMADFLLKAPAKQGTYDVRFRFAQASNCEEALKNWWNLGSEPTKDATLGQIIVR